MIQTESINVTTRVTPEDLEALETLAKSRKVNFENQLIDPDTWVVVAKEASTEKLVGGAAVHLSRSDEKAAELEFNLVYRQQQGQGIGNMLLKHCVVVLDELVGRRIVTDSEFVKKNKDDFEERKLQEQGNRIFVLK